MSVDYQAPFGLPRAACEIVCVRHGSTGQSPDAVDGDGGPSLSARGVEQADAVAGRLGDAGAAAIFVTPLRRTLETAEPLARRTGLRPRVVGNLREVGLGDWEGQFATRMMRSDPLTVEMLRQGRWDVIPNAEDMDRFSARVRAGMEEIAAATGPDRVGVAFLHGGVIAEACRQATGSAPFAFLYCENASITRLQRMADGRWTLSSFNERDHLRHLNAAHPAAGRR